MTARAFTLIVSCALALTASACIKVFPDPPPAPLMFAMRADPALTPAPTPLPLTLAIALPSLSSALAGTDLAAKRSDGSYAYIKGVRWTGPTPDMLQGLIIESLDRSGLFRAAVRSDGSARPDYVLQFDVTAFELERSGRSGEARFNGTARLVRSAERGAVATKLIAITEPAGLDGPADAARALQAVARAGAQEATQWAAATAKADQDAKAASAKR